MRVLLLLVFAAAQAQGQGQIPDGWWEGRIERKLNCQARAYPALLGFDFRYWTGVDFSLGLQQFDPIGPTSQRVAVLFRVTPQGRAPRYFRKVQLLPSSAQLPAGAPLKKLAFTLGGGVHLGAGKFKLDVLVVDRQRRACRQSWSVEAKPIAEALRQAPLTVEEMPATPPAAPCEQTERVAVVLNADVFSPRRYRTQLSARDRGMLLDSLESVTANWPCVSFTVEAVHLERRQIVLAEAPLAPALYDRLDDALRAIDLSKVDMDSLRKGAKADFFAGFIESRAADWDRYKAVIFLGPGWRTATEKLEGWARTRRPKAPRFYYVALSPFPYSPENLVAKYVDAQDGRILRVTTPVELAKAIKRIREDWKK
ncbi:MAG: hypothetical protein IT162_02000 [Bryobacterales bacterium]|nr:hypothetical protein [Bryobacterales bacterium]